MIVTVVFLIVVIAVGALIYSQVKPESVTVRELGRALLYAGVLVLVWWMAQQLPARLR